MNIRILGLLATIVALFSSCSSSKNATSLTYFEDLKGKADSTININTYNIRIVPDDQLTITVTSDLPEATVLYNVPQVNMTSRSDVSTQASPRQQVYIVNRDGDIDFPVLGKLHVEGMTVQELTQYLKGRISADVEDPMIHVELVNFHVNVLGEVKNPGAQSVSKERYTLLDALAAAGDLTEYGERENVLLIREEKGKVVYHHFNLNDSKTLSSPYFFLQQNDVIVVEPNKIRKDNSKYNQFNAYKVSVISTVVSAASVIASLVIALTVN